MIRLVLVSLLSSIAMFSAAPAAQAETAGSYSKCNKLGANAGACTACLRSGQMFNFDTTRKKWVCGDTTGMTRSKPISKTTSKPTKPSVDKQRPSSTKKR